MRIRTAQMLGVSTLIAAGAILFCACGCRSGSKPAAESNKLAQATQAPARPASVTQKAPVSQPKASVKAAPTPTAAARQTATIHVVRPGETLSSISQKYYGTRSDWKLILDANRNALRNTRDLTPSMKLVIPAPKVAAAKSAAGQPAKSAAALIATTSASAVWC